MAESESRSEKRERRFQKEETSAGREERGEEEVPIQFDTQSEAQTPSSQQPQYTSPPQNPNYSVPQSPPEALTHPPQQSQYIQNQPHQEVTPPPVHTHQPQYQTQHPSQYPPQYPQPVRQVSDKKRLVERVKEPFKNSPLSKANRDDEPRTGGKIYEVLGRAVVGGVAGGFITLALSSYLIEDVFNVTQGSNLDGYISSGSFILGAIGGLYFSGIKELLFGDKSSAETQAPQNNPAPGSSGAPTQPLTRDPSTPDSLESRAQQ